MRRPTPNFRGRIYSLTTVATVITTGITIVFCLNQKSAAGDPVVRQRFVVNVPGVVQVNSLPSNSDKEMLRVRVSSAIDVAIAVTAVDSVSELPDRLYVINSGQTRDFGLERPMRTRQLINVSLSKQEGSKPATITTPVLTITPL